VDLDTYRHYCLKKKGVKETFPFGENTLVFKVIGKMFTATDIEEFTSINLKVQPELGAELREQYVGVVPGYHMNKKHWITVMMDGSVPDKLIMEWIDNSYLLVAKALPKADREKILKANIR
jgi:predicted DNA-binding protein (MmcQ/YjbR family)